MARCLVARPFILMRHTIKDPDFNSLRMSLITSDSDKPMRLWIVSNEVLSSQAI